MIKIFIIVLIEKIKLKNYLLLFLSYIYFYPTAIVGPSFDFIDFHNFIYLNNCYSNMNFLSNFLYGFLNIFIGLFIMGIYGLFNKNFLSEFMSTEIFNQKNLLYKLFYINISAIFTKSKYHGAWSYSYGILIISGLSYSVDKKNDKNNYDIGYPGSIILTEISYNLRDIIINWDRSVHLWLKYHILLRLINVDNKLFKNNFTFSSYFYLFCNLAWIL